jgi:hypothetical protein
VDPFENPAALIRVQVGQEGSPKVDVLMVFRHVSLIGSERDDFSEIEIQPNEFQ